MMKFDQLPIIVCLYCR